METDRLAELIDRKHQVLAHLHTLARQQLALVDGDDMSNLLALLASKQTLLDQLMAVEQQLHPFRDQDPAERVWRSADDRRRCAEQARQCEATLAEILALERRGESQLQRRRDDTATRLDQAHGAAQAHRAYTSAPTGGGGQLDLASEG